MARPAAAASTWYQSCRYSSFDAKLSIVGTSATITTRVQDYECWSSAAAWVQTGTYGWGGSSAGFKTRLTWSGFGYSSAGTGPVSGYYPPKVYNNFGSYEQTYTQMNLVDSDIANGVRGYPSITHYASAKPDSYPQTVSHTCGVTFGTRTCSATVSNRQYGPIDHFYR